MSKILLVSVQYKQGRYLSTKAAVQMLEAGGHEIVQSASPDVVVLEGRHLPYAKPVKPAAMGEAKKLGLTIQTLDEFFGLETPAAQPKAEKKAKRKPKVKAKRAKKAPVQEQAAA